MAAKEYYICPVCKHKNEDTKKYCDQCGTWLLSETFPARKYQPKHGGALRLIGKAIGLMLLLLILVVIVFAYFNPPEMQVPSIDATAPRETEAEYKAFASEIDFKTLARNPEKLKGQRVKIRGKVTAVTEQGNNVGITLAMTEKEFFWDDYIFVYYTRPPGADRILEDDIITVWGEVGGLGEGTNIFGGTVSAPSVNAKYIEIE